ncbi:MAG: sulfurtransferase [Chitinivibrionales bacterium]|nr:sulfurtransferase [Chitinivibrionales bacterium]
MKNKFIFVASCLMLLGVSTMLFASSRTCRTIDPVVTTDWLLTNLSDPSLVLVDIRHPDEYASAHIPNAVNQFFPTWWIITTDGLLLELPPVADLLNLIGNLGIDQTKKIVIINNTTDDYSRADPGRVAWTLAYAGITNYAILDGGYTKWVAEGKTTTIVPSIPTPVIYNGTINANLVVSKEYVTQAVNYGCLKNIVDARLPADYFSVNPLVLCDRPGHIKKAVCLPTPWMFTDQGTYKPVTDIAAMAAGVIGENLWKEAIVYCGVGGYATQLWFVLSQILGYKNVKVYDGSIQEWTRDAAAPMTLYQWK